MLRLLIKLVQKEKLIQLNIYIFKDFGLDWIIIEYLKNLCCANTAQTRSIILYKSSIGF